jgi:hypothetical protein
MKMAGGELTVSEGLKLALDLGLRTKNYGPKAVGGRKIDMYRWKRLLVDPYYCGVIMLADWPEVNRNGLHKKMITTDEHNRLVALVKNKGKRFTIKRDNPLFPLSNEMDCHYCVKQGKAYPRLVGYSHTNGGKKPKRYERYRCRSCNMNILRSELHISLDEVFKELVLTTEQESYLQRFLRTAWKENEATSADQRRIELGRLEILQNKKGNLVLSLAANPDISEDIKPAIEQLKQEITETQGRLEGLEDQEGDFLEFSNYAIATVNGWAKVWWTLSREDQRKCKQILFPAGFSVLPSKNVCIPEISLVYRYGKQKISP